MFLYAFAEHSVQCHTHLFVTVDILLHTLLYCLTDQIRNNFACNTLLLYLFFISEMSDMLQIFNNKEHLITVTASVVVHLLIRSDSVKLCSLRVEDKVCELH